MTSRNRGSIYSFGDEGVTASVSALGRLLRVSRHFSGQDFGYCVDHPSIPEPYFVVDRITSLLSMGNDSGESLGIDPKVDILDIGNQPSAEFVHDRWPNFTMRGSNRDITMQFFASGGTIYQTYEFRFQGTDIQPPKLVTAENLLIRQLDFVDFSNRFNEAGIRSSDYETKLSEDQTCIKRSHHVDEGEVVLFIFACCKGELLKFQPNEENQAEEADEEQDNEEDLWAYVHDSEEDQKESKATSKAFGIVWSDKALEDIRAKKSLKLTFAYRLEYLHPRDERDEHVSSVNAEVIEAALQQMDHNPFEEHHFTDNGAINQALRRNLEHILSVCSIPVMAEGDGSGEPAVALTCGDVDGHRVATAASFYCFEFLLLALDYFESCPHRSDYTHWMTQRILKVCRGHLKWLFAKEYRNISKNPSIPHCWVSGKVIDSWDNSLYLPSRSLVDVPFQIIKAGDFSARHTTWEVPKEVGETVQGWIKELDRRNKLGRYAFPRYSKNPTHSFYLTDHVFIWRAVKSVESLKLNSKLKISIQPESEDNEGGQPSKKRTEIRNYSSNHVRNEILRRFTTENPMSKKKMMAVSRSPAHNRFLLRTKDAGLFHAMNLGFFDKPGTEEGRDVWENKIDVWRNLVDSQAYHEDNDDTTWDEPLRFALSFILSQRGMPMNRRPVEQMRSHALSVLTQSTWASGLFPGQLDANKEPILYDDEIMRDTYWAFSFEIPYLLWKFSEASSTGHDAPQTHLKDEAKTDEATTAPGVDSELFKLLKDLLEHQIGAKASTNPTIYTMKHSFPFNNVVDQKNIVELSDEWLYNEPDFFAHGSTGRESLSHPHGDEDCSEGFFPDIQFGWPKIAVVDVPRKRISKKDSPSLVDLITVLEAPSRLKDFMQQKRFRSKAKKRFCASFSSYPKINNAYPQTASEQPAMEAFSKRHMSYDKFFSEVTAAELNKWTTELHLSFYAIDRKGSSISPLMAFQRLSENGSPGGFTRIAMSFRFDGDFFDRYWTCHFLEYDPHMMGDFSVKDKVHDLLLPKGLGWSNDKKEPWRQRRVLELLLFDRIMSKMQEYTADILKEARRNAWEKPAGDTLNAVSGWGQDYQQILQTVEQDLHESLAKVEVWLNREKERMAERPRWTFNDESRYRGIISKLLIINQHRIQELTRCHASISKLNELIRSDLEQRRADDIKRFTYVTVVFLPLGFATGVFSMSEAPVGRTLVSMVVTAAVALAITVVLLKFSERFETLYNRLRRLVISWMIELKTRLVVWRLKPTRTPPAVLPGDPGRPREARGVQNQVEMV